LGGTPPYAFTEHRVAMLSSALNSERAIRVDITIMRAFVQLRKMAFNYADMLRKIESMERKYDSQFKIVFDAIKKLMMPTPKKMQGKIGFHK